MHFIIPTYFVEVCGNYFDGSPSIDLTRSLNSGLVTLLDRIGQRCCYLCSVFVPWLREFSSKGDVVRRSPSHRISGQIRKYLQQSEGGLSSYAADT